MAEVPRHIVDARQFPQNWMTNLFAESQFIEELVNKEVVPTSRHRKIYSIFSEPSNVTRDSFASAVGSLRWQFYDVAVPSISMWGEESARQVKRIEAQGFDGIIMRTGDAGLAQRVSENSVIPIFNAGEGFNDTTIKFSQHPSQALADADLMFTENNGKIDGLRVVVVGDKRRNPVINSLVIVLSELKASVVLAGNNGTNRVHEDVEKYLEAKNTPLEKTDNLREALKEADVLYIAHPQKFNPPAPAYEDCVEEFLGELPGHAIIMNDLERGLAATIDQDHRSVWESQLLRGVYTRTALLKMLVA